jgi:DNA-binding CsgD family transcriptional regulator
MKRSSFLGTALVAPWPSAVRVAEPTMPKSISVAGHSAATDKLGYNGLQRAQFSAIDQLSAGIILLDRTGEVVLANAAACCITEYGSPLRLRNSVLTAGSGMHSRRLDYLIQAALHGAPIGTMSIPHPDDGRLFTILVSSIRSRDIDHLGGLGARDVAAMLLIFDPARPLAIPAEWTMDAFGLTLAEARVALCAASGASTPETAQRLNVSPNTVKTHLRRVFAKTGTSRQAELARLMGSIGLLRAHWPDGKDQG